MMKGRATSGKTANRAGASAPSKQMMSYKKGGMVFKPCAGCPNPAACKKAGACMKKAGKK